MWSEETVLAALAYQTHGEGWRLGTGADVDLHIQHRASGACVHRCVSVRVQKKKKKKVMDVMSVKEAWVEQKWNGMRVESQSEETLPSIRLDQPHSFHSRK